MSPRSLEVRPTYPRRRLWPGLAAVAVLLVLGVWELRFHRPAPIVAPERGTASAGAPGAVAAPPVRQAAVEGQVLGADGKPAPEVTVVAAPGGVEARTGSDGRFRLQLEDGATVRLEAHHSDLGFAAAEVRVPAMDVRLRLEPRAALEVRVLSEGRPVAGAVVTVRQREGDGLVFHADRATDANGTMRFLGLPGGQLEVEALSVDSGARGDVQLETHVGTVSRVQLFLPVVGAVHGTVVNRGGAPVGGVLVGVEDAEGLPATSGPDGSFTLKGLRPGRDYRLTARTPDLILDAPVTARAGQAGLRVVVRDRLVFRGRVVGPGGAPLPSFSVDGRSFQADDGRFAVPLEPREGQIEIRVEAPGMQTRSVQSGSTVSELGDIGLQAAPELRGRVTLGGQLVADAAVSAGAETVRTDGAGAFVLSIREPQAGTSLRVLASKGDLAGSADATLAGPVEIALVGEQAVRIRVLGPSGAPAAGRAVQLAGARSYAWTTGADGAASGNALAGDYRISTDAQPGRMWFVRLPGREVVLGPTTGSASLEIDVSSPLEALWIERGIAAAPDSASRPGPRGEGQLVFGVDRSARFDGLTPGTWTVVGLRQGAPLTRTVQVSGSTRLSL